MLRGKGTVITHTLNDDVTEGSRHQGPSQPPQHPSTRQQIHSFANPFLKTSTLSDIHLSLLSHSSTSINPHLTTSTSTSTSTTSTSYYIHIHILTLIACLVLSYPCPRRPYLPRPAPRQPSWERLKGTQSKTWCGTINERRWRKWGKKRKTGVGETRAGSANDEADGRTGAEVRED